MMESKTNVLVVALVVAVLGASASALTVTTEESFGTRRSIANMIDDLGGNSATDFVLEIGTGGHITASARVDHDGPYSVLLNGGNFTCLSDGSGYKFPDNSTGNAAKINVIDGTLDLAAMESFGFERDCSIEIGADGTMLVGTHYAAVTADDGNNWNVGNMILEGSIYASTGLTLNVVDGGDGSVAITAVPEPTTLALLGLGALVSRRRKRA